MEMDSYFKMEVKVLIESIIVGILAALVVIPYRFIISLIEEMHLKIADIVGEDSQTFLLWAMITLLLGIAIERIVIWQPFSTGSGIPQARGIMLGIINYDPLKVILAKFFGGLLAIVNGLSLGKEGPSIQLGASTGMLVFKRLKNPALGYKYLISAGAGAGLAAAFNAPLAGALFVFEELHKQLTLLCLLSSIIASVIAAYISTIVFGPASVLHIHVTKNLPLGDCYLIIPLGVLAGVCGAVFNKTLLLSTEIYSRKISKFKLLLPTVLGWFFLFYLPQVMGGGNHLIKNLSESLYAFSFRALLVLFVVKFLHTILSYCSGAPGGIFLPILSLGALLGGLYSKAVSTFLGVDGVYSSNFIILGMVGLFAATIRAPVTGVVLILELIGGFRESFLLELMFSATISTITAEILGVEPIYEALLERLVNNVERKPSRKQLQLHHTQTLK